MKIQLDICTSAHGQSQLIAEVGGRLFNGFVLVGSGKCVQRNCDSILRVVLDDECSQMQLPPLQQKPQSVQKASGTNGAKAESCRIPPRNKKIFDSSPIAVLRDESNSFMQFLAEK